MKKSWKKILCSLMLAPCMFWAVACGDNPDDPNNLTVDLTAEQQQEAYTTLRTLASSMLDNDGSKDQAYIFEYAVEKGINKNIDNAGLTEENKNIVNASHILDLTDKTTQTVYGGYKTNNEGYYVSKLVYDGKNVAESYTQNYSEIVKYQNSQYNVYSNDNGEKTISKVTNDYSKNKVLFDRDVLEETEANRMNEFLNLINSSNVYSDFKSTLSTWISRTIAEDRVENYNNINFAEYISSNYSYSLKDGVYSLVVGIGLDATNSALRFLEDGNLIGKGEIVINYKSDAVQKITLDFDSTMKLEESPARLFGDIVQQEFRTEDKVVTTNCMNTNMVLDFSAEFDNNFLNQSLSDYNGQGDNNAILNRQSKVQIVCDYACVQTKLKSGENLIKGISDYLSPILADANCRIDVVYWDESYISEITSFDVVPSYDIKVYVKIVEASVSYAPATIIANFVEQEDISGEIVLCLNNNLYDEIKAVWGLTDDQIVGIYSDADLENKLPTSTLVSEGMTIYIVLEDGWSPIPPEAN